MQDGNAVIVAATILGLSILGGAYMIVGSVDSATREVGALSQSLAGLQRGAGGDARAAAPEPRRGPDPDKVYEIATAGAPSRGPADAPVTLVEFSDFQCPFCGRVSGTLDQIEKSYAGRVRIVFKHLPLSMHAQAPAAHAAAEAAHAQGHFWEMHDRIFANQRELNEAKYLAYAAEIGLDVERFKRDMASPAIRARIEGDMREAGRLDVRGTPGFFLNGRFFAGAKPYEEFKRMIDAALDAG